MAKLFLHHCDASSFSSLLNNHRSLVHGTTLSPTLFESNGMAVSTRNYLSNNFVFWRLELMFYTLHPPKLLVRNIFQKKLSHYWATWGEYKMIMKKIYILSSSDNFYLCSLIDYKNSVFIEFWLTIYATKTS